MATLPSVAHVSQQLNFIPPGKRFEDLFNRIGLALKERKTSADTDIRDSQFSDDSLIGIMKETHSQKASYAESLQSVFGLPFFMIDNQRILDITEYSQTWKV